MAARICHDLAGQITAIASGAELLEDETDAAVRAEFVAMIGEGAGKLASRLRFLRLVFGGGRGPAVSPREAHSILEAYLSTEAGVTLDWSAGDSPLERPVARLVLLLGAIGANALERGGALAVVGYADGWEVWSTGERLTLAADKIAVLRSKPGEPVSSRVADAIIAADLARSLGWQIGVEAEERRLRLSARS